MLKGSTRPLPRTTGATRRPAGASASTCRRDEPPRDHRGALPPQRRELPAIDGARPPAVCWCADCCSRGPRGFSRPSPTARRRRFLRRLLPLLGLYPSSAARSPRPPLEPVRTPLAQSPPVTTVPRTRARYSSYAARSISSRRRRVSRGLRSLVLGELQRATRRGAPYADRHAQPQAAHGCEAPETGSPFSARRRRHPLSPSSASTGHRHFPTPP